jgi:hypothetical protein
MSRHASYQHSRTSASDIYIPLCLKVFFFFAFLGSCRRDKSVVLRQLVSICHEYRMEKIGRIRKRLGNVKNIYTFSFITVHLLALVTHRQVPVTRGADLQCTGELRTQLYRSK